MSTTQVAAKNRRSAPRRSPKNSTRVLCRKGALGLGANMAVSVLDVSETGIRLLVKAGFKEKQEIEVLLSGAGQTQHATLLANVVWCVPAADGNFCIGARFQKPLPYGVLQLLTTSVQLGTA